MKRPRALHIHWEDGHRYVIRNEHGKLIAGTEGTFLADHATEQRTRARQEQLDKVDAIWAASRARTPSPGTDPA